MHCLDEDNDAFRSEHAKENHLSTAIKVVQSKLREVYAIETDGNRDNTDKRCDNTLDIMSVGEVVKELID